MDHPRHRHQARRQHPGQKQRPPQCQRQHLHHISPSPRRKHKRWRLIRSRWIPAVDLSQPKALAKPRLCLCVFFRSSSRRDLLQQLVITQASAAAFAIPQESALAFAVAVILSAAKDPEEFHSPKTHGPFQPYPLQPLRVAASAPSRRVHITAAA
jgi:hypothetical protein